MLSQRRQLCAPLRSRKEWHSFSFLSEAATSAVVTRENTRFYRPPIISWNAPGIVERGGLPSLVVESSYTREGKKHSPHREYKVSVSKRSSAVAKFVPRDQRLTTALEE
jgi:hypothetical protein